MADCEVPLQLRNFVKTIIYSFYEPQHIAIMSTLVNYTILDEYSLIELLQIDKKQFRTAISSLRNDKLLKQRIVKEKMMDTGAVSTFYFYYINYYIFLNVTRYKLDRIRASLITDEKSVTSRASFSCQNCQKQYADLEINQLLDMTTGLMSCYQCGAEVIENSQERKVKQTHSVIAKYNNQFEPFFKMIEELLSFEFSIDLIDPEPNEQQLQQACFALAHQADAASAIRKARFTDTGRDENSLSKYLDQSIIIKMGSELSTANIKHKPQPEWLMSGPSLGNQQAHQLTSNADNSIKAEDKNKIMDDLLMYEAGQAQVSDKLSDSEMSSEIEKIDFPDNLEDDMISENLPPASIITTPLASDPLPESSNSSPPKDDETGETFESQKVKIGDNLFEIDEITEDMLETMTPEEHDIYIKILNDLYKNTF